ncbi:multiheme c-type cytochrome [Fontimonas sp. SYSU GA230001]|uniref:multiheme c-type cytochrome n=1 Tax=Fontimonas sp. SYSU GA230001 TaxID=3142450 RepID=UPI0032B4D6FC
MHVSTWSRVGLLSLGLCVILTASAAPLMPFEDKWEHVGVATCAGSNCHGSQRPFEDSPVLQNEYFLWQRDDAHSNAYKLLQTADAKRIAANLGLKDATSAPECLTCHTDYVPEKLRGRRYAMSEGVGCEACHGGAKAWLGPHVSGNTHAQNIEQGLYPLEDPVARGRLCLHCHMGTKDKPIDHRIMGAGHPPLEFELDTFTNIQPAHFRVDKDYRQRKTYAPGAKVWAVGQLLAAETFLSGLLGERFADRGMFPELVFFDCNACHHAMQQPRWNAGVGGPLGPGEPRLADAYLVMSGAVLAVLQPESGARWTAALAELHRASAQSVPKTREAAQKLREIASAALPEIARRDIGKTQAVELMLRVAQIGIDTQAGNYTAAKQIYYASDALSAYLRQEHGVAKQALQGPLDELFAAVDAPRSYNPDSLRSALRKLRTAAEPLR